jgi:hypothetical protein
MEVATSPRTHEREVPTDRSIAANDYFNDDFCFESFSTVLAGIAGWLMSAPVRERHQNRPNSVALGQTSVIQTPKLGAGIMRYELADYEWTAIKPMLPTSRVAFLG